MISKGSGRLTQIVQKTFRHVAPGQRHGRMLHLHLEDLLCRTGAGKIFVLNRVLLTVFILKQENCSIYGIVGDPFLYLMRADSPYHTENILFALGFQTVNINFSKLRCLMIESPGLSC